MARARIRPSNGRNHDRDVSNSHPGASRAPRDHFNNRPYENRSRGTRSYRSPPRSPPRYNQGDWRSGNERRRSRSRSPSRRSPPRGSSYGRHRDGTRDDYASGRHDDYRDSYHNDYRHQPPPPPQSDSWRPPQGDFTFRMDKPAGVADFASYDNYKGRPENRRGGRRGGDRGRSGRGGRKPWKPSHPSERALIAGGIATEHEDYFGEGENGAKFRNLDEMSDDEEHDMDMSSRSSADSGFEKGPPRKRARAEEEKPAPKWSNPDPYTALPPPDEQSGKQKNVLALIRKARIEEKKAGQAGSTEAENFISFDTTDDEEDQDDETVPDASHEVRGSATTATATSQASQQLLTLHSPAPPPPPPADSPDISLPPKPPISTSSLPPGVTQHILPPRLPPTLPPGPPPPPPPPPGVLMGSGADRSGPLGSRKRTADDEIKPPDYGQAKRASKKASAGMLMPDWEPKNGENSCPWATEDHSGTQSVAFRLHKEIVDFYEYVRPQPFEQRIRDNLVDSLSKAMKRDGRTFVNAHVKPFGSYMSGLYLPTADMDLVICSVDFINGGMPRFTVGKSWLFKFKALLIAQRVAEGEKIEVISKARVPLVKYVDKATGLKVDVSFENLGGVGAVATFLRWKEMYPAMPILVTVIKHFLLMRGLNEPVNGGIGGFSVICLVVSMLQLMPQVQSRNLIPEHHLGEMLMEFLDLYGHHFNYEVNAISLVRPVGYVRKNDVRGFAYKNSDRLSIIDPNNNSNDISGGSSNSYLIFRRFGEAFEDLRERMKQVADRPDEGGVLDIIMKGDYSSFRLQRTFLKHVHEKLIGSYTD